ncbi:MAG: precorrin-8X methylmutase [Alphaproteobacteria bacterium]|nr:precorrin-8X methylmutase [Alphaproteobacteria bacterium]
MGAFDYIKDPAEIYALSFERVRAATSLARFSPELAEVVIRVVHACGMPDAADDILASPEAAAQAITALAGGAPVLADCAMVASGITKRFLHPDTSITMTLYDEATPARAKALGTTRSAAAVEDWRRDIGGAVVAIGNAPTALFHLLEKIDDGWPKPAVILAFPVGFVGAAESKAALAERDDLDFITLSGTRGGSAMASAAVNAAALLAQKPRDEVSS